MPGVGEDQYGRSAPLPGEVLDLLVLHPLDGSSVHVHHPLHYRKGVHCVGGIWEGGGVVEVVVGAVCRSVRLAHSQSDHVLTAGSRVYLHGDPQRTVSDALHAGVL